MLRRIAATGNARALWILGRRYAYPQSGRPDCIRAKRIWLEGARQNEANSLFELSRFYSQGLGDCSDELRASYYLKRAADLGLTRAQYLLGTNYLFGITCEQDYRLAHEYLSRAAANNSGDALCLLSTMYQDGLGVTRDKVKANNLIRLAQTTGCAEAEYRLGAVYAREVGVDRDYAKALYWLERAVNHKNNRAFVELARLYFAGTGVKADTAKALSLLDGADSNHMLDGQANLAWRYFTGAGLPKDLKRAEEIYTKLANQNDARGAQGLLTMGMHLEESASKNQRDDKQAKHFYEKAASYANGDSKALCYLADLAKQVHNDKSKTLEYYEKAAAIGDEFAAINISVTYLTPDSKSVDYQTARRLLQMCADKNEGTAEIYLAHIYEEGLGVEKDLTMAAKLKASAVRNGCTDGDYHIGNLYFFSTDTTKGKVQAMPWYLKAAAAGNPHAKNQLAHIISMGSNGAKPDRERAEKLRMEAAHDGCPYAYATLADKYARLKTPDALKKTRIIYERAQRMGNLRAEHMLKTLEERVKANN